MILVEPIGNIRCQWGEAPIWWRGHLYVVDIEGMAVHRMDVGTGEVRTWDCGMRVGTVVPRASGGLLCAGDRGLFFLDESDGRITLLADPEVHLPENRFNDGKCSPDGRFFAGSISLTKKTGTARLYRFDPDHSLHEVFGPVTNSNGLAWSPDGSVLYYIDTPRREVLAFDYRDGALSNMRSAVNTAHLDASPDGMTIDADGHLWVAFCHGGCVSCFDPRSGDELHRIAIPCLETTSCAFGGADLDALFVTTGVHRTAREEHAGRVMVVRGLAAKGLPSHAFAG